MRRILLSVVVLGLAATACSVDLASGQPAAAPAQDLATTSSGHDEPVTVVVQRVLPAVVNVTTDVFQPEQSGGAQQGQGVGTGFIVRQDGVIVTNCHVVEQATHISVFTSAAKPVQYDARVIGGDCLHDVAVLKVDATGLPTVPLGSSGSLVLGQRVVALGYALALEGGPTVTAGIVSSLDRTIQAQDPGCSVCRNGVRTYANVVQTDAAINHGNSGGPLVNMQGQVVGIDSAGADSAENIGFAIAIDSVKSAIQQAIADPLAPSAYLGVSTQSVTSTMAFQLHLPVDHGAYVLGIPTNGPATKAGINQGDVIVGLNGSDVKTADDLGTILSGLQAGQSVQVQVIGPNGQARTLDVTLGTRPLPTQLP